MKIEPPEIEKIPQFRRNIPTEIPTGDRNSDDAGVGEAGDIHAGNAGPAAGVGVVLVPVGEGGGGVVNGGLEGE